MPASTWDDRLRVRQRPVGSPLMHQSWQELLFLHRNCSVEEWMFMGS